MANLNDQLANALDGASSMVTNMASQTETKCKYFMPFVEKIQKAATKFREGIRVEEGSSQVVQTEKLQEMLQEFHQTLLQNLFNPALDFPSMSLLISLSILTYYCSRL